MAHEKVYAICEDKCREETITKAKIESVYSDLDRSLTLILTTMDDMTIDQFRSATKLAFQEVLDAFGALVK